jgi:hypothetical protein
VRVGRPSPTYEPRRAADSVIYQVVRDHYETHALVLDGVFADDGSGTLVFHPALPPDSEVLDVLLETIARRIDHQGSRASASTLAQPLITATQSPAVGSDLHTAEAVNDIETPRLE